MREPRSSSIGAASAASELGDRSHRCPPEAATLVSMLSTPTTPVGITSGAESSETVARETSTKSGSSVTSSTSCAADVRTARPITPSSSGRPSGIIA